MFINNHRCIFKKEYDMWVDIYTSTCCFSILNENKSIFNLYNQLWYASVQYLCQMWFSVTSMSSVTQVTYFYTGMDWCPSLPFPPQQRMGQSALGSFHVTDIVEGIVLTMIQVWNFSKRFIKPCYWKRNYWPQEMTTGNIENMVAFVLPKVWTYQNPNEYRIFWKLNFKIKMYQCPSCW